MSRGKMNMAETKIFRLPAGTQRRGRPPLGHLPCTAAKIDTACRGIACECVVLFAARCSLQSADYFDNHTQHNTYLTCL